MSYKLPNSGSCKNTVIAAFLGLTLATGTALPLTTAYAAQTFNPHSIITDTEMRQANAMSQSEIAAFLEKKGKLNNYTDKDPVDGVVKNVSQLIADAATRYSINPKYLITLIQKESGLIESKKPSQKLLDWATGYGLCDGCRRSSPLAQKYKGLAKQIDAGAGWMDWYFKKGSGLSYLYHPGSTYIISKISVTPTNTATAALYGYTPHIAGNKLFFNIWQRYFDSISTAAATADIPDGAVVKNTKTNEYSVVQGGLFRTVKYETLIGTRFSKTGVILLSDTDYTMLTKANPGRPITFADLSLVRVEDGSIYLLVGNTRRKIASPEVFSKIGFNPEEVENAPFADIANYTPGPDITLSAMEIETKLLQDMTSGTVYYIEGGFKHPLLDKALLTVNFPGKPVTKVSNNELDKYTTAEPIHFLDGSLVKATGNPTVYLISGNKKRAITSEAAFLGLGFSWSSIITTSTQMLNLHETGEPIIFPLPSAEPVQTASL